MVISNRSSKLSEWKSSQKNVQSAMAEVARQGVVSLDDGTEIYYEDTGGDGQTLVFLYGLGCNIQHWKYQIRFFLQQKLAKKKPRLVWLDYRGHGLSTSIRECEKVTIELLSKDVAEALTKIGVSKFILFGQSFGGTISLSVAATNPDLVRGLVLVGCPAEPVSKIMNIAGIFGRSMFTSLMRLNQIHRGIIRLIYRKSNNFKTIATELIRVGGFNANLANIYDVEEYVEQLFETNPNVFLDLTLDLERNRLAGLLDKISCPSIIIAGQCDRIVPVDAVQRLAKKISSTLVLLEHGSHCPHMDDPDYVNEKLFTWLGSIS